MHWDGGAWKVVPAEGVGGGSSILFIVTAENGVVLAAGTWYVSPTYPHTTGGPLIEIWSGTGF